MKRAYIFLIVILAACSPGAATLDPYAMRGLSDGYIASTSQAQSAQATAAPATQSAENEKFWQSLTATFAGPALTATTQANEYAALVAAQGRDNATATASARTTQNQIARSSMLTAIPATGTALAVSQQHAQADARGAESWADFVSVVGSIAGVLILALAATFGYWVLGRARADVKRRTTIAENSKPHVIGNMLLLPTPTGGWIHHPIVIAIPAQLPAPAEIENRNIPVNGKGGGELHFSSPVNDHEREWRSALVQAAMIFEERGMASTALCGKGLPFASASHWKDITDRLADNGLIIKDNGAPTLPAGQWGDIISRLQDANKPLRLPASRPPRLRVFSLENAR